VRSIEDASERFAARLISSENPSRSGRLALRRQHDAPAVFQGVGQRHFTDDVFAGFQRSDRDGGNVFRLDVYGDGVDVRTRQHVLQFSKGTFDPESGSCHPLLQASGQPLADCYDFGLRLQADRGDPGNATMPHANDADADAFHSFHLSRAATAV